MGETKNLFDVDAIEKLKEFTQDKVCMFCTYAGDYNMTSRPMSTNRTDYEGNIWFLSDAESDHNEHIKLHSNVDLLYANSKDLTYCTIKGRAEILRNQALINELWNPIAKAWFTEGKEDPRITIIKVTPAKAHYWDTKSNKFISFLKIAASAAVGKTMDDGRQGDLVV